MAHGNTPRNHYILNEELDLSESRCTEFKSGGRFINNGFRDNVGKYVCGFLNSHEDGTLMIGIEDSENYSLKFVPVYDNYENHYGMYIQYIKGSVQDYNNRYVIEIRVRGPTVANRDRLYECRLGVFLRRDGSLEGPLQPREIQEWTRQQLDETLTETRENRRLLSERSQTRCCAIM